MHAVCTSLRKKLCYTDSRIFNLKYIYKHIRKSKHSSRHPFRHPCRQLFIQAQSRHQFTHSSSNHPSTQTSIHDPDIQTLIHPDIQASTIQTFQLPAIHLNSQPDFQTSKHSSIHTSSLSDVQPCFYSARMALKLLIFQ